MQHKDIPNAQLHETKGASTATVGQVLIANGDGTATFQDSPYSINKMGWWDYQDTATSSSPIALTTANTEYQLTNDGLGDNTNDSYKLADVTRVFNTSTNYFDFTGLSVGDTIDMRIDVEATTSTANTVLETLIELGIGEDPFKLTLGREYIKTASTTKIIIPALLYVGSTLTQANPARLLMKSDTTGATIKVNGWYVKVTKHG
jgi:hypothetical protein